MEFICEGCGEDAELGWGPPAQDPAVSVGCNSYISWRLRLGDFSAGAGALFIYSMYNIYIYIYIYIYIMMRNEEHYAFTGCVMCISQSSQKASEQKIIVTKYSSENFFLN